MKKLIILGSTGTIGKQCLDIVAAFPQAFKVIGLACQSSISVLSAQCQKYHPKAVCISDPEAAKNFSASTACYSGTQGLLDLLELDADIIVFAIHGSIALKAAEKALLMGKKIALANKEILVAAGSYLCPLAEKANLDFLVLDSEHSALQQLLKHLNKEEIEKVTLTASGGPFWQKDLSDFASIKPESALKHPSWSMGQKITIDSATLLNKGFEIIEAHFLFGFSYNQLTAIIHPQSIVHALIESIDGAVTCHLGPADMRYPIQYALFEEKRQPKKWKPFDLQMLSPIEFYPIPTEKFPLFQLAIEAGKAKGCQSAILTSANDLAVEKFLNHQIAYTDIHKCIVDCLEKFEKQHCASIDDIIELDHDVKEYVFHKY